MVQQSAEKFGRVASQTAVMPTTPAMPGAVSNLTKVTQKLIDRKPLKYMDRLKIER